MLVVYLAISLLKVSLMHSSSNFSLTNDTALFRGESALQYHYAEIIADGKRIPEVDNMAQFPEGVNTKQDLTVFMEKIHGWIYFIFAVAGGAYFLKYNLRLVANPNRGSAMACFHASLLQLSLLLVGAMLDAAVRG